MKHVMVDLETLGTSPGSVILSIGAVEFDPQGTEIKAGPGYQFHQHIDLVDSMQQGFGVKADTLLWWLNQSDEARSRIVRGQVGAPAIKYALSRFADWCLMGAAIKEVVIWGNGASFDNALLSEAYLKMRVDPPWEFWNDRCYRTIKGEYPDVKLVREGTHHDALHDAISQAKHLQAIYQSKREQTKS
jgi:hypothetical protein